jgi:hypothetical protein
MRLEGCTPRDAAALCDEAAGVAMAGLPVLFFSDGQDCVAVFGSPGESLRDVLPLMVDTFEGATS